KTRPRAHMPPRAGTPKDKERHRRGELRPRRRGQSVSLRRVPAAIQESRCKRRGSCDTWPPPSGFPRMPSVRIVEAEINPAANAILITWAVSWKPGRSLFHELGAPLDKALSQQRR